jgi:hypothetical protein
MATLREQAEALGIQVDNRWSDETLQAKIDQAMPGTQPVETATVRLTYDWWDADGVRRSEGEMVKLPIDDARYLVSKGKAERTDPIGGE